MAAALALMESPASIIASKIRSQQQSQDVTRPSLGKIFQKSLKYGGQLFLLGSMVIGIISGDITHEVLAPFSIDLFKGILSFFLLDGAFILLEIFLTSKINLQFVFITQFLHA
jgi:hypothetical protein